MTAGRSRIAYLQKAPSGHSDSCLRALVATGDVELFATLPPTLSDSPFKAAEYAWIDHVHPIRNLRRVPSLIPALLDFDPELLLIVGWEPPAYRKAARALSTTSYRVVCMDQQYRGTIKQRAGILGASAYLHPYFDGAFVPGDRQHRFARRLGFQDQNIYQGFYSCDVDAFVLVDPITAATVQDRRAFLYVGRLAPEKGIDTLLDAYRRYRRVHNDPWDLILAGTGPLESHLRSSPDAELLGFVQPGQLADVFGRAACLVLPSSFEPWGVVVHEASAAGLGLICTTAVGAADSFLLDGANGRLIEPGDVAQLEAAMCWFHRLSANELERACLTSRAHSQRLTPERWASTVLSMAPSRQPSV